MGIFGSKKKRKGNEEEVAVAVGVALHLNMSEISAAIATALDLYSSTQGMGKLTIRRNVNSPWKDINRALSMKQF